MTFGKALDRARPYVPMAVCRRPVRLSGIPVNH